MENKETLEEAAEKEFDDNLFHYQKYRYGFIKGAKSDVARDYWFNIFRKELENEQ